MEEESEETRPLKRMNDPKEPSAKERRSHAQTHLPYRTWCAQCVRSRGKAAFVPLRNVEFRRWLLDNCFPGSEGKPES